jgi:hypothetical protein
MQRRRPRFLRARQDEIQPLNLSRLGRPHPHESRTIDRIAQSRLVQVTKTAAPDIVDLFCNLKIRVPVLHSDEFRFESPRVRDVDFP